MTIQIRPVEQHFHLVSFGFQHFPKCVVPETIHTPPTKGHWKFLGEGVVKSKLLHIHEKYEGKLEFPWGSGGVRQKTFRGVSMDIFWNYTMKN